MASADRFGPSLGKGEVSAEDSFGPSLAVASRSNRHSTTYLRRAETAEVEIVRDTGLVNDSGDSARGGRLHPKGEEYGKHPSPSRDSELLVVELTAYSSARSASQVPNELFYCPGLLGLQIR